VKQTHNAKEAPKQTNQAKGSETKAAKPLKKTVQCVVRE
jgi:hypothetical protein